MSKSCAPAVFLYSAILYAVSLFATPQLFAQSQPAPGAPVAAPRMYDTAKESVVRGAISEVVSRPKVGLPLGLHLIISTAQGAVDVHLGPYFARIAAQKGLVAGATIQVTGVSAHFAPGDVFLARLIVIGNETLVVRNANGFPVRPLPAGSRGPGSTQPTGGQR